MSVDARESQDIIDRLMREFRELVVGIEDEHFDLKSKLKSLSNRTARTLNRPRLELQSTSSSLTTNNSDPTTTTASPTEDPSTATNTTSSLTCLSSTTATTSTKPPPYKSVVRIGPLPPIRTKRRIKQNTVDRSTSTSSIMGSSGVARGALIVFEGLDRVGKSTLAKKLVDHLERLKKPVSYCRFPDRTTPIGKLIDEFLRSSSRRVDDHSMHLLFSANRWELSKKIRNTILDGTTVIVDRYSYSGIAYSSSKSELSIEWCRETERGLPKPDLVIYLDLSRDAQYTRSGFGNELFETKDFQECARRQYQHVIGMSNETWLLIDVEDKSPDQLLGEIIVPVKRCLESSIHKDLGKLDFI